MRAVIQRVTSAKVVVAQNTVAQINKGLLILLGVEDRDGKQDIDWLAKKISNLRIFNDANGVMNTSLLQTQGDAIVVSQFTLHAATKKGNRPSYIKAAKPEVAKPLYQNFVNQLQKELGKTVGTGVFGANMQVSLCNDGPVTIIIDTQNKE